MPYNTRRKSLSLTELGITLPKRSRTHSQSSPSNTNTNTTIVEGDEPPTKKSKRATPPPSSNTDAKSPVRTSVASMRFKEEAKNNNTPSAQLSPPPSPVAEGARANRVDVEGINDDIVVATIRQLEQTGNRPHLVKELAAILSSSLGSAEKYDDPTPALASSRSITDTSAKTSAIVPVVLIIAEGDDDDDVDDDDGDGGDGDGGYRLEHADDILNRSTNPSALISSRLTAYINRPWPAVCPCPLAKDLTNAHPRRLYFYLTTLPRQPLPPSFATLASSSSSSSSSSKNKNKSHHHGTISPVNSSSSSASNSASSDDVSDDAEIDAALLRQRQALSPSPEVDLSSPELYEDAAPVLPGAPFSGRSPAGPPPNCASTDGNPAGGVIGGGTSGRSGGLRAASPQLENEERDFKRVATAVYEEELRRRRSRSRTEELGKFEHDQRREEGKVHGHVRMGGSAVPTQDGSRGLGEGAGAGGSGDSASLSAAGGVSASTSSGTDVDMSDSNSSDKPTDLHTGENDDQIQPDTLISVHSSTTAATSSAEYDGENEYSTKEQRQNREAAAALFGTEHLQRSPEMRMLGFYGDSSPVIAPRSDDESGVLSLDEMVEAGGRRGEDGGKDVEGAVAREGGEGGLGISSGDEGVEGDVVDNGHISNTGGNSQPARDHDSTTAATSATNTLRRHGPIQHHNKGLSPTRPAVSTSSLVRPNAASDFAAARKELNAMVLQPSDPYDDDGEDWAKSLQSPETVELEELEDLFDAY